MGRKAIDLTGQKFGHVIVLKRSEKKDASKRALWICQCDCGKIFEVASVNLRNNKSGENYSCGCKRVKHPNSGIKTPDITNQRFGWMIALKRNYTYAKENNLKEEVFWDCQCDCGNIITVRSYSLIHGLTKSCGCMKNCPEDLTGKKFGKLLVLKPDFKINKDKERNKTMGIYGIHWICQCDCGQITSVSTNYLSKTVNPHCNKCQISLGDDLTNKQFGFLTVIERDYSVPKEKGAYWKCKCVCGNFTSVRTSALKDGSTKSCGCKRKELTRERQMIDITGKKFGHLLAIEPVFDYAKQKGIKNSGNIVYWKCQCDCGSVCIEPGTELRSGEIINCANCASVSKGEEKIKLLLDNEKITYIYNNNYFKDLKNPQNNNCLRYDFIVVDKNKIPLYLIEYDGEQHFKSVERWGGKEQLKKQQSYDNIKNTYAINHNLPLIRIPYTHYKDLCLQDLLPETSKYLITTDSGFAAERIAKNV